MTVPLIKFVGFGCVRGVDWWYILGNKMRGVMWAGIQNLIHVLEDSSAPETPNYPRISLDDTTCAEGPYLNQLIHS